MVLHCKVAVKGLTSRNMLELQVHLNRNTWQDLKFINYLQPSGLWFHVVPSQQHMHMNVKDVQMMMTKNIINMFQEYEHDESMVGYVDLPLADFTVDVTPLDISDALFQEYNDTIEALKDIEDKRSQIMKKGNELLAKISKI